VCTSLIHNTVTSSCSHTCLCVCVRACVCTTFLLFLCLVFCMLNNANVFQLHRALLSTHSSPEWDIMR
jgi:hypothetical protein